MNTNNRLVTVCIPAYNHEKFIQETINSIIKQTYKNIELLIINDGSPDNTHEKIMELYDECRDRFVNFLYINRENRGLISTLNEFIQIAKGDYFSAIASDDIALETKIKKQVEVLEKNPDYGMCYGNMISIDNDSNIIPNKYKTKYNKSGYLFEDLLFRNFITAPTVMLRKSVLDSVGGYDTKYKIEDHPLWLKIAKISKIYYLNEDLVYYRDHPNNMSKNISFMIEENEKMLNDWSDELCYNKAIQKHNLYSFIQYLKADQKDLAKKYMLKSFAKSWYHPKYIKTVIRYFFK